MFSVFSLIGLLAVQAAPVIRSYDPPPADFWEQSVLFKCGRATLQLSGFGPARPLGRPAKVRFNGRPLRGSGAELLLRDLSSPRAVYRLSARCPKAKGNIALIINSGEKLSDGAVVYRSGSALIKSESLDEYAGLQAADAESFWFR